MDRAMIVGQVMQHCKHPLREEVWARRVAWVL